VRIGPESWIDRSVGRAEFEQEARLAILRQTTINVAHLAVAALREIELPASISREDFERRLLHHAGRYRSAGLALDPRLESAASFRRRLDAFLDYAQSESLLGTVSSVDVPSDVLERGGMSYARNELLEAEAAFGLCVRSRARLSGGVGDSMTGGAGDGFLYSQGLLVIPRIPLTLTLRQARRWLPLIVGLALMCLMVWAADPLKLAGAVRGFDWRFLLPLTLSYFLYLAFRSARWHLLMRPINAPNSWTDSLLLFCAAQAAVLVPAGQFLLPVLQKSQHGTLIRRSAATVLVQEVMFGLLVLPAALPSILGYQVGGWFLLAAFLISAGAGALILHDGISNGCFFVIDHLPFIGHHCPSLRELR